ncbi:MAG: NTP transferase domain-containing protein [Saprospiraceae bacterium]|nr:NTP transferase domain-containing protein [Saprospiraceae bacterium]
MKAIIPVAGAGTRLRPLTYTQPKPLIPVAGKPIISFIIDQLVEVGIRDFVFIIGYLGEKIKNYVEQAYPEINKEFVNQEERLGSAHAIWIGREHFAKAEEVFIFFGDVIIDANFQQMVNHPHSCVGVKKVQKPWEYGVVETNNQNVANRMVEKPKIPKSDLAMVGIYKIKEVELLVESMEFNIKNDIRTNGEYPLTDALQRMLEGGVRIDPLTVDNWFNCGKKEVLLETNSNFLDRSGYASTDLPEYENTIIIHPVSIGENCKIKNSVIGPHVTISNNAKIERAIIRNSIIGNYAHIKEIVLQKSVVGNDTSITGMRQSFNIGDNTEIDFSSPQV